MRKDQRTNRERQPRPGVRRILDALKALKEERLGLVEKAPPRASLPSAATMAGGFRNRRM